MIIAAAAQAANLPAAGKRGRTQARNRERIVAAG
jgi:hypothetical protein